MEVRSIVTGHHRVERAILVVPASESRVTCAGKSKPSPIFDSAGSQINREAAVSLGIVNPANDRWFVQFNRDKYFGSE